MTRVRWAAALVSLLTLGCECATARPTHSGLAPTAEPTSPPAAGEELVAAASELSPTTAALIIEVRPDALRISNVSWVQSWPEAERAALRASHPEGIEIDEALEGPAADALSHRPTYEILSRVRALDLSRAGGSSVSGAFALRVHPDAPWGAVLAILFSAAQAGYVEPRFVYGGASGEVWLPIPLAHESPGVRGGPDSEALAAAVAAALEGQDGPAPTARAEPVRVRLDAAALHIRTSAGAAGPGCVLGEPQSTLPIDLPATTLADCAGSLRGEGGRVELAADRSLPWSRVAPALEALAGRFPVELSASLR